MTANTIGSGATAGVVEIRRQRRGAGRVVRGIDQQLAAAAAGAAIRAAPATRTRSAR